MRKKLLLADDSITIQKVVELTFPSDEFEVVTAGNGRLALDKAMTFLPDLVLCDVIMPQLDGYQVCEALRASPQLRNVPILLLSGAFEPYDADRARAVGALGNVSKPFDPPALVARVKEILADHSTAAFERPPEPVLEATPEAQDSLGSPMALEAVEVLEEPLDLAESAEPAALQDTDPGAYAADPYAPDEYTYDESGGNPVSTIEVSASAREAAARSMDLDTPVFASPEPEMAVPEVDTPDEEPTDLSETLHGPFAGGTLPMGGVEAVDETLKLEPEAHAFESVEPEGAETESEAPSGASFEGVEFEAEPPAAEEVVPQTLPPGSISAVLGAAPPAFGDFAAEREFEAPMEATPFAATPFGEETIAESSAAAEAVPFDADAPSEPEASGLPEELAEPEPMSIAEPEAAPEPAMTLSPEPEAAIGLPARAALPPVVLQAPPAPAQPAPLLAPTPPEGPAAVTEAAPAPRPPEAVRPVPPTAEPVVPADLAQQIAQRVIAQVSERIIREIAWDVIPSLAEKLINAEIERIKARADSERD